MNEALLLLLGRLHPLVLHLPIGLLTALLVLESLAILRRRPQDVFTRRVLSWLLLLSTVAAVASGLALSREGGYAEGVLNTHKWLGIAFAAACAAIALFGGRVRVFRWSLAAAAALLVPGAHFGGTMTHGADFLTEPLREILSAARGAEPRPATQPRQQPAASASAPSSAASGEFERRIAPILAANCIGCHGQDKQKGRLALHTPEAIREGGRRGAVIVPGAPAESELLRRMRLPLDDEQHMPPEGKPQPSSADIATIEAWIAAGAALPGGPPPARAAGDPNAPGAADGAETRETPPDSPQPTSASAPAEEPPPERAAAPAALPADALAALREAQIHAEVIDPAGGWLWIDAAAAATLDEPRLIELLAPLSAHVIELSLAGSQAGDALLSALHGFDRLERLDLSGTRATIAGLRSLRALPMLRELNIARLALDDGAIDVLAALPALRTLRAWQAGFSSDALAQLAARRTDLSILATAEPAAPLETEPTIAFTSDAPAPEGEAALPAVNAVCPVSGQPVQPRFRIVHEGRVIGFCCAECVAKFWAGPEAYPLRQP